MCFGNKEFLSLFFPHSKHLADAAPPMKPLVYEPERGLQAALGAFLQDKVFIDEDDGMLCSFVLMMVTFIVYTVLAKCTNVGGLFFLRI